jgi:lipopolysaccharide transport system ATP-binding protein
MSETAIRVENLSKKYALAVCSQQSNFVTLRDQLTQTAQVLAQRLVKPHQATAKREEFWALKEVNFEIKRGEIVGIVGRNGAGKSTLLKILSRITEPTTGQIELEGRIASLLEVGTGFHPELTGRENIFLNGAILGMGRSEIQHKFDEIVSFAEVEKFLETPVKRYSSGMYVRLAFAVAAHLEPEILIIDEVLAVGDAAFQKKCLGKIEDVATKEGRTVLFVSHNMLSVRALCQRAYLLDAGRMIAQGSPGSVIETYLQSIDTHIANEPLANRRDREGDQTARFTSVRIEDAGGRDLITTRSRLKLTLTYQGEQPIFGPQVAVTLYDYHSGIGLIALDSECVGGLPDVLPAGGTLTCITEPLNLTPGRCYIDVNLLRSGDESTDYLQHAAYFDIEAGAEGDSDKLPDRNWAVCLRQHQWSWAAAHDLQTPISTGLTNRARD